MPKKHALILANTEYRDAKLAPISAPGQGYADLAEAMKDPARGAFAQVETLVNGNLSQILHALDRFFSRRPADDFLLVYFCGHGLVDPQGEIFLALRDSDRYRLKSTALMAAVLGMNMDLCPSPHKALVLDCRFHAAGNGAGTPPRIEPDKVFGGRGIPKVILSSSDAVEVMGRAAAPEDRPYAEFTRLLAECLRPPATAVKKTFTLQDWWNATLAPFKASGQANTPRLHAVGNPPETVLRGISVQVPEMALSSEGPANRSAGQPENPAAPAADEPAEEQQWSRLSGIFPLEMIAPELAIPPEAATDNGSAPAAKDSGNNGMWDLRVPPALDGERTMMWDRKQLNEAMKAEQRDLTPRDSFADMRARLLEQEEEEKQALIEEEEEEALQKERLEQWKSRWENRRDGIEKDESEKNVPRPAWSQLAELQKTIFFDNPSAEDGEPDVMDPPPKRPASFPTGEGMDTVIVSREEFLEPSARRPEAAFPALPKAPQPPAAPTPPVAPPPVDDFADLVGAMEMAVSDSPASEAAPTPTLEMESAPEEASAPARPEEVVAAPDHLGSASSVVTLFQPSPTIPDSPAGYLDEAPARETTRRPLRAPKRGDKTEFSPGLDLEDSKSSLAKRVAWICMGFVPVFLMVLLYFAARSGLFMGSHETAGQQEAAKVVPAEEETPPAARPAAAVPAPAAPKVTPTIPKPAPSKTAAAAPAPAPAPSAAPAPVTSVIPEAPKEKAPRAQGTKTASTRKGPSADAAANADFELAAPRTDSILAAAVEEALKADAGSLQAIYDRFALGFPGLKGEVTIDLKVDPSGWILEGAVQSSSTSVDLFDQEVLRKVLGWKLRAFPGEKPRSVPVPLRFPLPK
jgi:outer membrane biosynthesis protein TonB